MTKIFGIDVSYHNGAIDWNKVKNDGVEFAILRAGRTSLSSSKTMAKDTKFEEYYQGAKAVGLPVGAYYYSRCATVEEGKKEGEFIVSLLKGKKFEYPIFLDVEDTEVLKSTSKTNLTAAIKACMEVVENAGYYVAMYSGKYILRDNLIESELTKYDKWIAQYAKTCTYDKEHTMWQFGGETNLLRSKKVQGVSSACCDQNYCYVDYTSIIKEKGLNGYTSSSTTSTSKADANVKNLQTALNNSYKCGLAVDGLFGPLTQAAVKKYYLKNLTKNEHAKWLQQALKNLGYNISVDGSYGPETERVVKQFQKSQGISADGYAGLDTHTKLINALK